MVQYERTTTGEVMRYLTYYTIEPNIYKYGERKRLVIEYEFDDRVRRSSIDFDEGESVYRMAKVLIQHIRDTIIEERKSPRHSMTEAYTRDRQI